MHTQEHPSPDVGTQEAPLVDMFSQEEGIPSRTQVIRNTTEDLGLSEQTLKQTRMEKEYEDALEFTLDGKKGETLARTIWDKKKDWKDTMLQRTHLIMQGFLQIGMN